jgi:peptidoglycan/xylan/chitin deacetylase (PgdA/CDA1 family)
MEIGRAVTRLLTLLLHDVHDGDPSSSGFPGPAADRYKLTVTELDEQLAGLAAAVAAGRQRVPVTLTFDDGGVSYYTTVAERLEARGWRGHCLVTTGCIGRPGFLDAAQIRELHSRGHVIGTHSVSHPRRFAACSWDRMVREWADSRRALQDIVGCDVTTGSVPGGYFTGRVARAADAAGLRTLFTSEPETRVRRIGGCTVVGRFTLRPGCRPDFAARLARMDAFARAGEWTAWNVKKVVKRALGEDYPRFADWAARANR